MPLSKANQQARREVLQRIKKLEEAAGISEPVKRARWLRDGQKTYPKAWLPDVTFSCGHSIIHVGSVAESKFIGRQLGNCARYMEEHLSREQCQMYAILNPTYKIIMAFTIISRYPYFELEEAGGSQNRRPTPGEQGLINRWLDCANIVHPRGVQLEIQRLRASFDRSWRWYERLIEDAEPGQIIPPPPRSFLL